MGAKREGTSARKVAANRKNALQSTGPRTSEGKAVVAQNAIRHGLLSRACLMPGENAAVLKELRAELRAAYAPAGTLEDLLVDQLVSVVWRMRRAQAMEAGALAGPFTEAMLEVGGMDQKRLLNRTFGMDSQSRPQDVTVEGMASGSALRRSEVAAVAFERAARYGTALERSLFRALHELERVQAARKGERVPMPRVLDVTVEAPAPGPH
jgi:hypothetical protein